MNRAEGLEYFRQALDRGRLGHAYIVEGATRGEGLALAEDVLRLLFCAAHTGRPCGLCVPCGQIGRHVQADVHWVEPQSKARRITVDDVRELQRVMLQTSTAGGWKAGVLVDADRMQDAAPNVFLKTLEEPPPRSLFLLLTSQPQMLLPTITSRCQWVTVGGDAGEVLDGIWRDRLLAVLADTPRPPGSLVARLGRTDRLVRLLKEMKESVEAEAKTEARADETADSKAVVEARISARYREMRARYVRSLLLWSRDVLVLVCGAGDEVLHHADRRDVLRALAGGLTYAQALASVKAVEDVVRQLERNVGEATAFTVAAARLV